MMAKSFEEGESTPISPPGIVSLVLTIRNILDPRINALRSGG